MAQIFNIKNTKYLVAFVFIINVCINIVKNENDLLSSTDYTLYSNQTEIELVVSNRPEYNLNFIKLNYTPKLPTDFTNAHLDLWSIHKNWLIHFQGFVIVQLESFNRSFIPNRQFISILHNMWHHSSIELGDLAIG